MDFVKKKRSTSLKEKLVEICFRDFQNGFFLACFKIFHTHQIVLRLVLIVFVLVSTSFASYLVVSSVLDYFSYEVISTSRTIYEEAHFEFPKVTFCNVNPFTTKYAVEFLRNVSKEIQYDLDIFNLTQMSSFTFNQKDTLINDVYTRANILILNKYFKNENRKRLGHSIEDILIKCKFNGENCFATDFTWKFDR